MTRMSEIGLSLLAFGFGSPWLLGGLALAAIPLIIHLLHRRRYVEVDWAAMRFLLEATRKQSRRMRLENLILLILRTFVLALLVLALARPLFDSGSTLMQNEQPVHRIVLIDVSYSMQFNSGGSDRQPDGEQPRDGGTRFQQARQAVRELVEHGRRGDAWNLVRIAGRAPFAVISQPSFQADTVLEEVERLTPSDAPGDLASGLEAVAQLTTALPDMPQKEVIIVSDQQGSMWSPGAADQKQRLRELTKKIGANARVSLINVAGIDTRNTAITDLRTEGSSATIDQPVLVRCAVRSFGSSAARDQVIELLVDGRLVDTRRIDVPAGVDFPVDFTHTFRTAGEHSIELHLQDDALPVDNRRWLALPVREEISVLLVDGHRAGRSRDSASYYVRTALDPATLEESMGGIIRTQVVSEGELPSVRLADYDATILCDVGLLTEREAGLLESYVRGGGGLIILPGEQTSPDSYNRRLHRDGKGILPARIGERVLPPDPNEVFSFDPRGFTHPLLGVFRGNPGVGLETTMTMQFLKLEPDDDAGVGLWFSDGSPALVEKNVGAGRVVLAATGTDKRWSTWAVWAPAFVPMMHEAVHFSVAGRWKRRQLTVGEPLLTTWSARAFDVPVSVELPGGATRSLPVQDRSELRAASFDDTDRAGVYEVSIGSPVNRNELFAVNVDVRESDLTPVNRQDLQSELFRKLDVTVRTPDDPEPVVSAVASETAVSMLSRILAWTVLVMVLVEPLLAWRFPLGLTALGAAVGAIALAPLIGMLAAAVISTTASVAIAIRMQRRGGVGV